MLLMSKMIDFDDRIAKKFSVKFAKCLLRNIMVVKYESHDVNYQSFAYLESVVQKYLCRLAKLFTRVASLADFASGE